MQRLRFRFAFGAGVILIGVFTISTAGAQNFRSANECMQALSSRCISLMDRNAKTNCFKGNKVYCQKFDRPVILTPEQRGINTYRPEDMRQEGATLRDVREYYK